MKKLLKVLKRDGSLAEYDSLRIRKAIQGANDDLNGKGATAAEIRVIFDTVTRKVEQLLETDNVSVEKINDIIEETMMKYDCKNLAKQFIEYRYDHKMIREFNTTDKAIEELVKGISEKYKTENSNKNSVLVTTQRDYIAGITSEDISRRFLIPEKVVKAHDQGLIHFHDIDYYLENARTNCCLCNLEDMLQNGTVLNNRMIEKPHRFITACTVATQIITAVSSSQYGGVTVTLTHLAPFVRNSFYRHFRFYVENMESNEVPSEINEDTPMNSLLYRTNGEAFKYASLMTAKEVTDGVQTFNYQVNSMSSTNGQAPFISVFMYLNETDKYKDELAMIVEEFLKQRIQGIKNEQGVWITPAFPKLLYVLEEDNVSKESKYWYITELAAKCTAKRMVPDYISEKMMKFLKINKFGNGDCYPCMGCRSFLTPDRISGNPSNAKNYRDDQPKYYGRFNVGVVTINLADAAASSKGDEEKFWKILDERCEICHLGLKSRISRVENATSDVAPILWQHGGLARLKPGQNIKELIYGGYATASLGCAALYECVRYMKGVSHTDPEGKEFGMRVMQFLNDKCSQWKKEENIDYSVYGTPLESTTYKFAKCLKSRFGDDFFEKLDGHDRLYVTNSYHVPVFEKITAFDKLAKESEFQKLTPGGAISYIETPNMQNNIDAVISVMQFIYNNIMYAELNTKSDYCQVCGFDGEIGVEIKDGKAVWKCPKCGNTDQNRMHIVRRTCGYLGENYWSLGRTNEIADRVLHL